MDQSFESTGETDCKGVASESFAVATLGTQEPKLGDHPALFGAATTHETIAKESAVTSNFPTMFGTSTPPSVANPVTSTPTNHWKESRTCQTQYLRPFLQCQRDECHSLPSSDGRYKARNGKDPVSSKPPFERSRHRKGPKVAELIHTFEPKVEPEANLVAGSPSIFESPSPLGFIANESNGHIETLSSVQLEKSSNDREPSESKPQGPSNIVQCKNGKNAASSQSQSHEGALTRSSRAIMNTYKNGSARTTSRKTTTKKTLKSTDDGFWSLRRDVESVKTDMLNAQTCNEKTEKAYAKTNRDKENTSMHARSAVTSKSPKERGSLHCCTAAVRRQPMEIHVCILIDDALSRLFTPLFSNLEKFWDLMVMSSEQVTRISVVTRSWHSPFVSEKEEFLAFAKKATQKSNAASDCGIVEALLQAETLQWEKESQKVVYIFTDLLMIADDQKAKEELLVGLRQVVPCMPRFVKLLIASWLDHNDPLVEILGVVGVPFHSFPALDVKRMVSHIVDDRELLDRVYIIRRSAIPVRERKVKICNEKSLHSPPRHLTAVSEEIDLFDAMILKPSPISSIKECLSQRCGGFSQDPCEMYLYDQEGKSRSSEKSIDVSCGGLLLDFNNELFVRSLKIDVLRSRTCSETELHYKNRAFASTVGRFMAQEYNLKHRPVECAKVCFVEGSVIVRNVEGGKRCYYSEEWIESGRFQHFCNSAGQWNESVMDETLLRFAISTFKVSGGDLVVVGLKGVFVEGENTFLLSTPTVLSKFGSNPCIGQCNKEYIQSCRKRAKSLLEQSSSIENPAKKEKTPKDFFVSALDSFNPFSSK
ncbi:MAG: hypothetical protein SGILL_002421 [Bacillariaceae sp.]